MAEGETVLNLGTLLAVDGGEIDLEDLKFEFLLDNGQTLCGVIHVALNHQGDFDRNGIVDGTDFLLWQRTLGSTVATLGAASANLASASVPEPGSAILIGSLLPALAWFRIAKGGNRRGRNYAATI